MRLIDLHPVTRDAGDDVGDAGSLIGGVDGRSVKKEPHPGFDGLHRDDIAQAEERLGIETSMHER